MKSPLLPSAAPCVARIHVEHRSAPALRFPTLSLSLALALMSGPGLVPASAAPDPDAIQSLLPDSSLETANVDGTWAKGWGRAKNVTWETEDGNHFFRVTADPGKQVGLYMSAPLATGTQAVELSFRARVTGLERGEQNYFDARVIINFKDEAGKRTPPKKLPYFSKDTDGWVTVTHRMLVPESATVVELMPSLFKAQAGQFDFDDIVVKPIDPALVN
jgi:endoglucanase